MLTREEFERWASSGVLVADETDDYYKIRLFWDSYIYAPKSDQSVTPCLLGTGWESWISAWMMNNIKAGQWFFDIGANSGYYSVLALRQGASQVFAFEPNPDYRELLLKTFNGFDSCAYLYSVALSDSPGKAVLRVPGSFEGSASIRDSTDFVGYDVREVLVDAMTLDDVYDDIKQSPSRPGRSTIVKIDAEGAEEMILDGGQEFLSSIRPILVMEYTQGKYSDSFIDKLTDYGYLSKIDFDGGEQQTSREEIESSTDWIMLVIRPKDNK